MSAARMNRWGYSRRLRLRGRHFVVVLLAQFVLVLLALGGLVLLDAGVAFASAPMCDPSATTVSAPLPAPPSDDGSIVASTPCESEAGIVGIGRGKERYESGVELRSSDATPPGDVRTWAGPARLVQVIDASATGSMGKEHRVGVDRPPCFLMRAWARCF